MKGPLFPGNSKINNAALTDMLAEYLSDRMKHGDTQSINDWCPDHINNDVFSAISHRNRTTKKQKWVSLLLEDNILNYIKHLIEGFLMPDEEKNYLQLNYIRISLKTQKKRK